MSINEECRNTKRGVAGDVPAHVDQLRHLISWKELFEAEEIFDSGQRKSHQIQCGEDRSEFVKILGLQARTDQQER